MEITMPRKSKKFWERSIGYISQMFLRDQEQYVKRWPLDLTTWCHDHFGESYLSGVTEMSDWEQAEESIWDEETVIIENSFKKIFCKVDKRKSRKKT